VSSRNRNLDSGELHGPTVNRRREPESDNRL
jgi:hypothetical protein